MKYPTLEEVNKASHEQIAKWYRYLPSPNTYGIGKSNFKEILDEEALILNHIIVMLQGYGGMTPQIGKKIDL
jgi:hypothetical protein